MRDRKFVIRISRDPFFCPLFLLIYVNEVDIGQTNSLQARGPHDSRVHAKPRIAAGGIGRGLTRNHEAKCAGNCS